MKKVAWLAILLLMTGCANMTAREKQTAYIVGVIVIAAVAVSSNSGHKHEEAELNCFFVFPSGGQVCQ